MSTTSPRHDTDAGPTPRIRLLGSRHRGPLGGELRARHDRAIAELAHSEERWALAIRAANDGLWDWDLIAGTVSPSPRWYAILGRADGGDLPGQADPAFWLSLVHPADSERVRAALAGHLDGRTPRLHVEHRMRHADGGWRWVVSRGLAIRGPDGAPTRMAGSICDVTDRRRAELRRRHDARHDALTGLPNRARFTARVDQSRQRDPHAACAVLFLDVDRLKLINDSLGRAVGDRVLMTLAGRLASALRPGDTVARLGGDEFAVLLEDIADPADASLIAGRILRSLDAPLEIDGHEVFATVSIGIALSTPGADAAELIGDAGIAMDDAKRGGRGRRAVFDAGMRRRVVHRLARENELRHVVQGSLLAVHYQPIVDLAGGRICGMEALARWPEARGAVAPSEFIAIAEDTGVIGVLGQQVLEAALSALSSWRRDGLVDDDIAISVNLSAVQLDDPGLADQVSAAIERAQLPPAALRLEITESTLVADMERSQHVFAEVCGRGVGLHLDDFGTGYSSLSALHRLPVTAIKIDRSFVAEITDDQGGSEVIIRGTVAMAHSLGLPVIAEGIETPAQLRCLRALGCEFGQGHLFSPALSAPDTRALLPSWRPADIVALLTGA